MYPYAGSRYHTHVHSADATDAATDDRCKIFIFCRIDSGCIRSCRTLSDRPEVQSHAGSVEKPRHRDRKDDRKIYKPVILEQKFSEHRNIGKHRNLYFGKRRFCHVADRHISSRFLTDIFSEEVTESGSEDRQRQSGYILVRTERDRQKAVNQRTERSCKERTQKRDQCGKHAAHTSSGFDDRLLIIIGTRKSGDRTHEHHTFHTKV